MKFSFRLFLVIAIFGGIFVTIFSGMKQEIQNNPNATVSASFFHTVNPFWKFPDTQDNIFPVQIPIPVENPNTDPLIVTGQARLFDINNTELKNIGLIGKTETSSGTLVDYIEINPENTEIPPNDKKIFEIFWHGFGDKYISSWDENGLPIIVFETPSQIFQDFRDFHLSFYEKPQTQHHQYLLNLQIALKTLNTRTNITTEQPPQIQPLSIPYTTIKKTLNTGLIINIGFLAIIFLLLSLTKNPPHKTKYPRISREELEKIEAEIRDIKEKRKNSTSKKFSQKNKQKNNPEK